MSYFIHTEIERLRQRHFMAFFLVISLRFAAGRAHDERASRDLSQLHANGVGDERVRADLYMFRVRDLRSRDDDDECQCSDVW